MSAVILAAGGTGGHMVPAHAVSEELRARGHRVMLLTDERGLRFPGLFEGVEREIIPAATFSGANPIRALSAALTIARGRSAARRAIRATQAQIVVGFGGYPALPALLGGLAEKLPTLLHEQNAVLGRVNRALARRVERVALSYADTARVPAGTDTEVTGNPVRAEVLAAREQPFHPPAPDEPFNLLVTGGSQGASILSRVVPDAIIALDPGIRARLHVVQQCRPEDLSRVDALYKAHGVLAECLPYMPDLPARMAAAHLVIGRSGASTMAELGVVGRPAILVPFAAATDDHQTVNAREFVAAGGGVTLSEQEFSAPRLGGAIAGFVADSAGLAHAAAAARQVGIPDAGRRLADIVETMIGRRAK